MVILNKEPQEVGKLDKVMQTQKHLYEELVNLLEEANLQLPLDTSFGKYPNVCKYSPEDIDTIIEDLIQYHIKEIKAVQPYLSVTRMLIDIEKTETINLATQLFEDITYIKLYGNELLYNEYLTTYIYQSTIIPEVINLTNDIGKAIKLLKKIKLTNGEIHELFYKYELSLDLESYNIYNLEHYLGYTATDKDSFSARMIKLRSN